MLFLLGFSAEAQVIAPSAEEVIFTYESTFITNSKEEAETLASAHASHFFGFMQSHDMVARYGLSPEMVGGVGAPLQPMKIQIKKVKKIATGTEITYRSQGPFLLHKKVAQRLLRSGHLTLQLPYDLDNYYDEECTDPDYPAIEEFWYFFDPYQIGCEKLIQEPLARKVEITVTPAKRQVHEESPRLDLLRGDNGNGEDFMMTMIHGFAESSKNKKDEGRVGYEELNEWFREQGFSEKKETRSTTKEVRVFRKTLTAAKGKTIELIVERILVDTDSESRSTAFAKYFKEAAEKSDVLYYGGHSGLGSNLDIEFLEERAGSFKFNNKKRQIFFFDACSSYSYYLEPFRQQKTKSKLDVISNGLSSYFNTGSIIAIRLMEYLFDPEATPDWMEVLTQMEEPLGGGSYLLNVGGV